MMLQLLGLAMLLPNDTEALRRDTAQCPLKPSAPNRHERKYFVVFTRPHSGADLLCKLLNRHPEISCAGELFNPTHASADRLGLTVEQQRADVQGFVQAHIDRCRTRVCGFRMMASHLPREALPKLFVPGCGVQKVRLQPATCGPICGSVRSSVCSLQPRLQLRCAARPAARTATPVSISVRRSSSSERTSPPSSWHARRAPPARGPWTSSGARTASGARRCSAAVAPL